jgi:putative hydrolase of the HAD superfamily
MFKAVTFDAGDTLFRLREPAAYTYVKIARRFGCDLDPDRLDCAFRKAWKSIGRLPDTVGPRPDDGRSWWWELVQLTLNYANYEVEPFSRFFDRVYPAFAEPGVWVLAADTEPVLHDLRKKGLRLGIISNFDRRLYKILGLLGIADYFEHVIVSSEVGADKPSPRIFREAGSRFGLQPIEMLHVGDDETADAYGAAAVGMPSLIIDHSRTTLSAVKAAVGLAAPFDT